MRTRRRCRQRQRRRLHRQLAPHLLRRPLHRQPQRRSPCRRHSRRCRYHRRRHRWRELHLSPRIATSFRHAARPQGSPRGLSAAFCASLSSRVSRSSAPTDQQAKPQGHTCGPDPKPCHLHRLSTGRCRCCKPARCSRYCWRRRLLVSISASSPVADTVRSCKRATSSRHSRHTTRLGYNGASIPAPGTNCWCTPGRRNRRSHRRLPPGSTARNTQAAGTGPMYKLPSRSPRSRHKMHPGYSVVSSRAPCRHSRCTRETRTGYSWCRRSRRDRRSCFRSLLSSWGHCTLPCRCRPQRCTCHGPSKSVRLDRSPSNPVAHTRRCRRRLRCCRCRFPNKSARQDKSPSNPRQSTRRCTCTFQRCTCHGPSKSVAWTGHRAIRWRIRGVAGADSVVAVPFPEQVGPPGQVTEQSGPEYPARQVEQSGGASCRDRSTPHPRISRGPSNSHRDPGRFPRISPIPTSGSP